MLWRARLVCILGIALLGRVACLSQEAELGAQPSSYHTTPLPAPKGDVQTDIMMIIFFFNAVLLSPQRNFSFHEINSDYIKFHFSETEI